MATVSKTNRLKRIRGLGKAAAALGVTRQHLGWVLHGRRKSPSLVRRYQKLHKLSAAQLRQLMNRTEAQPSNEPPNGINLAASQNMNQAFQSVLAKLGLSIVVVGFKDSVRGDLSELLEGIIQTAHAGSYDSLAYVQSRQFHFFHVPDAAACIHVLKQELQQHGLLEQAEIFTVEGPDKLTQWHPAATSKTEP